MAYRHYYLFLIIRIVLLLGNVFLTGGSYLLIPSRDLLFLPIILSLILVVQSIDLVYYLQRMSREVARFIDNLDHKDLSEKFDEKSVGPPFRILYRSLNRVVSQLEETKIEKEAHFSYLQVILGHISTGIISVREDDRIVLLNESARELLDIREHSSWNDLDKGHRELVEAVDDIKGRGSRLVGDFSVNKSSVKILGTGYRIITIQDIRTEIEQKEIEAWHKLIQILRHEIRNSVTPITSMSETILMLLEDQSGNTRKPGDLREKDLEDIHQSIRTVHGRSERLYQFVEKYRQLTRVPPPQKQPVRVQVLLHGIQDLFRKEVEERNIRLSVEMEDNSMLIDADPSLAEQVLINLVRNSILALEDIENGRINMRTGSTRKNFVISVEDNGAGIDPASSEDIFLPFYTTREEGMGIGLSLSRQIMNLHGGTLSLEQVSMHPGSESGYNTVFNMAFPFSYLPETDRPQAQPME